MRRVPGSSGVAPIWVDGRGMNRIIVVPGANLQMPPALGVEAVGTLRPVVVVGQFEVPQATAAAGFEAARRAGAITVLNPAPAETPDPGLIERHGLARPQRARVRVARRRRPRATGGRRGSERIERSPIGSACRWW